MKAKVKTSLKKKILQFSLGVAIGIGFWCLTLVLLLILN
ncbi:Uncharacterised protein [Legionella pneumophila]|nr:Uncharacterised protein [Legionella pneumophila]